MPQPDDDETVLLARAIARDGGLVLLIMPRFPAVATDEQVEAAAIALAEWRAPNWGRKNWPNKDPEIADAMRREVRLVIEAAANATPPADKPRGHSAIWSMADLVAEWRAEDKRFHVVKSRTAIERAAQAQQPTTRGPTDGQEAQDQG